jgi:hypothetical protein
VTREKVEIHYQVRDYWQGQPSARDARIDEIEVSRRVTRYPVTKSGAVQWSQGAEEKTELFRLPVEELGSLVRELIDLLTYYAAGRVLTDLGFEPAREKSTNENT